MMRLKPTKHSKRFAIKAAFKKFMTGERGHTKFRIYLTLLFKEGMRSFFKHKLFWEM